MHHVWTRPRPLVAIVLASTIGLGLAACGSSSKHAVSHDASVKMSGAEVAAYNASQHAHRHLGHRHSSLKFLFAHDAAAGAFTPVDGRKGVYRLALSGVRPSALYYSDKPGRIVGAVSVQKMLTGLFHKRGETHSNAAINAVDLRGSQVLMGVELMSASYDPKNQTLVYTVHALKQGKSEDRLKGETDRVLPARLGHTSLFIDTFNNECEAAITNNANNQVWTLQSATENNPNDSWGADSGYGYPADIPTQTLYPGYNPNGLYGGQNDEWYGDTSGFARGCSNTVVWKGADGTILTINLSDPYSGSNTYTCSLSTANYTCTIDDVNSFTSGDTLDIAWDINPS